MKFKSNKTLLFSLITLSAVSIAAIGFSSWVVGIFSPSDDLTNINVQLDTVSEETCFLNMTLTNGEGITIADDSQDKVGDGIGVEEANCDLVVGLDEYDFAISSTLTFTSLKFEVKLDSKDIVAQVDEDDNFGRTANTNLTYIELPQYEDEESMKKAFNEDLSSISGYKMYTAKQKSLTFVWGSYFGYKSPALFYQEGLDKIKKTKDKLIAMQQIKSELNEMDQFFKNGGSSYSTINIKATLTAE